MTIAFAMLAGAMLGSAVTIVAHRRTLIRLHTELWHQRKMEATLSRRILDLQAKQTAARMLGWSGEE